MASLTLTNVRPWGDAAVDIVITDGRITDVRAPGSNLPPCETIDGEGMLALPGFINSHAHVDKSWWGQAWVSYGGATSTQGRIAHERAERGKYDIPSVAGATTVLREFLRHGTTATRSHVDVDPEVGLRGIEMVRAAAEALDGAVEVEIVAFTQDGVLRRPRVLNLLARAAEAGATTIGGLDPASIDRDPVAQLDGLFEIAERRHVGLDIHLHDGGDLGAFQFELIADRTRRAGLQGRVTVSHGFALGDVSRQRQDELVDELTAAGVAWATVSPVAHPPLPWSHMRERAMALGLGTDGIRDLWSPFGDGDMLRIALRFAEVHRLRTDADLTHAVSLATRGGAPFVHRALHDLTPGARGDVVLLRAENAPDALMRAPLRALVVAGGRVVARDGELVI